MEDVIQNEPPRIKKEVITREIHQWRKPDGTYAKSDQPRHNRTTISVKPEIKDKIESLRQDPKESFGSVIAKLVKEHFILQLIKKRMTERRNASQEDVSV